MYVYFEVAGDILINRRMLRMAEFAGDAAPAFEAIGESMLGIEKLQFESEGARTEPWAPLQESTIKRKEAEGLDLRILHATLELEKSLTSRGGANRFIVTPNMLVFGSELPYASVHQNPKESNPLPQRRPIDFTEADKVGFIKTLQAWIMAGQRIKSADMGVFRKEVDTHMGTLGGATMFGGEV
jgi:phage gpG-like protein